MNRITTDEAYFAWFKSSLEKSKAFFYEHPSVLLSTTYLALSFSGLIYLYVLGRGVGVDIIKYLELVDFIMAFLATPAILYSSVVALITTLVTALLINRHNKKQVKSKVQTEGWRSWLETYRMCYRLNPLYLILCTILILPSIYSIVVADLDAEQILLGKGKTYQVDLVNPVSIHEQPKFRFDHLKLVTETERFSFFYSEELKQVLLITRDNMASVQLASQGYDN